MKPERVVSVVLAGLAAGLAALLVFGPTEPAGAKADVPEATTTAAPTTATAQTTPVPETTTAELEPTPSAPTPSGGPGDGTLLRSVIFNLAYPGELRSKEQEFATMPEEVRIEATAAVVFGSSRDVHGVLCSTSGQVMYTLLINPWAHTYSLLRGDPVTRTGFEIDHGDAPSLVDPSRPNVLSLRCAVDAEGTALTFAANGKRIAEFMDEGYTDPFTRVGVTAWSPEGGQQVRFDDLVVKTD